MQRKIGLRLQIMVALGVLLVLAFVPLWQAVARVTEEALGAEVSARARDVAELLAQDIDAERPRLRGIGAERPTTLALCLFDASGRRLLDSAGNPRVCASLLSQVQVAGDLPGVVARSQREHEGIAAQPVVLERASFTLVLWERLDVAAARAHTVLRLALLYMLLFALALLAFAYFALTWLIVRPVEVLTQQAERVERGAELFEVPRAGAQELTELGEHLASMTRTVRANEALLAERLRQLTEATASLTSARRELEVGERLASVGRLAAGVAHEIGNPLTAIMGLADLMADGDLDGDDTRDFAQRIRGESERAHGTIRDLLDFARARPEEDGERSADLAAVLDDVTGLLRPQKGFRDIVIERELADEALWVAMAPSRLTQIVLNLALNAQDAMLDDASRRGAGRLRFEARRVEGMIELDVRDDGPGVADDVRERLFEPFVTTKEPGRGTGLGLAVCRSLAESAQGTLELVDHDAPGARFRLRLPSAAAAT